MKTIYALIVIPILIIGCSPNNKSSKHLFKVLNEKEIVLPNAGSSWYVIKINNFQVKCKNLILTKGEISLSMPSIDSVVNIDILKNIKSDNTASWSAYLNITNQQMFSITLDKPIIYIQVNKNLSFTATELDIISCNSLMYIQEGFIDNMGRMIDTVPQFSNMLNIVLNEKGNFKYSNPNALLDWLPRLYVYDGPSLSYKYNDSYSIFLTGGIKGNKMVNYWLDIFSDSVKTVINCNGQLNDTSGNVLKKFSLPLPDTTQIFYINHWSTHNEFLNYWKIAGKGKPVPSMLLSDAGIVIRTGMLGGSICSDMMTGGLYDNPIIIRSNIFTDMFVIGQPASVIIAQKLNKQ